MATNSEKDDKSLGESLGDETDEDVHADDDADDVEEAAEVLMTDMTLDDDMDKLRDPDPGPTWIYHIEVYPWHADDVNERFIRLMKLATFTNLCVRKKPISHEADDPERIDDKVMERQRKGSLHLYAESYQTARSILRHSTWNNMMSKELTFEITKRNLDSGNVMTAKFDVDTGSMSKVKFRNKAKGGFQARTAKVSNIPGEVTRDILDIVFCRSYVAYTGQNTEPNRENKDVNPHQTLSEIPGFKGYLDVDCLTRGSCRSLVLALKCVSVLGKKLSIAANDSQTMVVPPEPQSVGLKPKEDGSAKAAASSLGMSDYGFQIVSSGRGREVRNNSAVIGRTNSLARIHTPVSHAVQSARIHPLVSSGRLRGMGAARGVVIPQQPACSSFTRSSQGMPVPMTGRQKMNEKIRRNHPSVVLGAPNTGVHPQAAASTGFRTANMKSMGDSFKQEIASLQSELERSTQAIEAKIERLKEESSYYSGYNEEMQMYVEGDWVDSGHDYQYEVAQDEYFDEGLSDYYVQSYDAPTHNAMGYDLYEQPIEVLVPTASRGGQPRRGPGRGGRGFIRVSGQRPSGFVGNNNNNTNTNINPTIVRNPAQQMRNARGRGGSGGGGMVYHGSGTPGGYW